MAYTGDVDQDRVSELEVAIGRLFEDADEMGFVITYHAAKGDGVGVADIIGRGISQHVLEQILADVIAHNRQHGSAA